MLRIVALSDWRVQRVEAVTEFLDGLSTQPDLLVYGGDDTVRFGDFSQLAARTRLGVAGVMGNDCEPEHRLAFSGPRKWDLHSDPLITEDATGFIGLEGSPPPLGFVTYTEGEAAKHLERQFRDVTRRGAKRVVVVSHAPPKGVLDLSLRFGTDHFVAGAPRKFSERHTTRLPLVLCGHSHLNGGESELLDRTLVVNTAVHDHDGAEARLATLRIDGWDVRCVWHLLDGPMSNLRLLQGIGSVRERVLLNGGLSSLDDIVEDNRERLLALPGVGRTSAARWLEQADAIRRGVITIHDFPERELLSASPTVYYDIETDLGPGRTWLVGALDSVDGKFVSFFQRRNEGRLLRDFRNYLKDRPDHLLVSYSGSSFDARVLSARSSAYKFRNLAERLASDIDFCKIARRALIGNTPSHKLKELAHQLGYRFRHPDIDGFAVGLYYSEYLLSGKQPPWKKLIEYNQDDVRALAHVVKRAVEGGEVTSPSIADPTHALPAWEDPPQRSLSSY